MNRTYMIAEGVVTNREKFENEFMPAVRRAHKRYAVSYSFAPMLPKPCEARHLTTASQFTNFLTALPFTNGTRAQKCATRSRSANNVLVIF